MAEYTRVNNVRLSSEIHKIVDVGWGEPELYATPCS